MSPTVRRLGFVALLITGLHQSSAADPPTPDVAPDSAHDPVALPTPWIDQGASPVRESVDGLPEAVSRGASPPAEGRGDHKLAAALTLGGLYAGFTTWTYFAWYRQHKPLSEFKWGGDGWLETRTYAGGADKFGHAWATMSLARAGTELLRQWGGYSRLTSALIGTGLAEALFLGVEVKDGFYYEFSFSDATGNTLGALFALAMSLSPRLDELLDYRVQYWPSSAYRRQFSGGNVNIAEDYTGETFLLAFHLGGIHALRDQQWGTWARFVDVAAGFATRGYKPDPPAQAPDYDRRQDMYLGISLNAQGLFDWLLDGRSNVARKLTHGVFEVFNPPATFVPLLDRKRTPDGAVAHDGA